MRVRTRHGKFSDMWDPNSPQETRSNRRKQKTPDNRKEETEGTPSWLLLRGATPRCGDKQHTRRSAANEGRRTAKKMAPIRLVRGRTDTNLTVVEVGEREHRAR